MLVLAFDEIPRVSVTVLSVAYALSTFP